MNKILIFLLLLFAVNLNAQVISVGGGTTPTVRSGLAEPTILSTDKVGDKYFKTQDGTLAGKSKNSWVYNGAAWMGDGAALNEATSIRTATLAADTLLATEKAVRTAVDLSATRNFKTITQTAHGFTVGQCLYFDGTQYALASASSTTTMNTVGFVEQVVDANNFVLVTSGISTVFTVLTPNTTYYLDVTAGAITSTKPATNIRIVLTSLNSTDGFVNQYATSDAATTQALTSGRVNALLDLASTTHINTDPGTKIPFTGTVYTTGMTTNAGSIIPSVTGKYRADWLCMAASTEFLADGIFFVVQNGVSVGQVSYNMNEASAVNQSAGFIDVTLVAGQEVSLHYRTRHNVSDGISWDRGSYFQLTQLPTAVAPVVNAVAENGTVYPSANLTITSGNTSAASSGLFYTFTLPSAGEWEVNYVTRVSNSLAAGNAGFYVGIFDSGTVVPNTELQIFQETTIGGTSFPGGTGTGVVKITTTGAKTYQIRVWENNGIGGTAISDGNGRSYVFYNKIAGQTSASAFVGANGTVAGAVGFVPAPAATDNVKFLKGDGTWGTVTASLTSGQNLGIVNNSITSSASFVDIPGSSFTLPAAGTWMVTYDVQGTITALAGPWGNIRMTTSANVFVAGSQSELIASSDQGEIQSVSKTVLVTTAGSAVYKLQYATQGGNFTIYNNSALNGGGNSNITWIKVN